MYGQQAELALVVREFVASRVFRAHLLARSTSVKPSNFGVDHELATDKSVVQLERLSQLLMTSRKIAFLFE